MTQKYAIDVRQGIDLLDPHFDNVDVEVCFEDGQRYTATFFTLENIRLMMNRYLQSGECNRGKYFWSSDMIIVDRLTEDTIRQTIDYLLATDEFELVFLRLED